MRNSVFGRRTFIFQKKIYIRSLGGEPAMVLQYYITHEPYLLSNTWVAFKYTMPHVEKYCLQGVQLVGQDKRWFRQDLSFQIYLWFEKQFRRCYQSNRWCWGHQHTTTIFSFMLVRFYKNMSTNLIIFKILIYEKNFLDVHTTSYQLV